MMRPSTGTISDHEEWPAFAEEFARQLILKIQSGTDTDLMKQLGIDVAQLQEESSQPGSHRSGTLLA